jgi:hemerythrin superfamily protein
MSRAATVPMPFGVLPPPDVVDLLLEQHSRARDLMTEVLLREGEQRKTAFRELVRLLSVHEAAEQEVVHPTTRRAADGGAQIVADRLQEERDAKELLKLLDGMDPDDPDFLPLFLTLRESVVSHAVAEQKYEFNNLRKDVGESERAGMRALVQVAEKMAPTHPHPSVQSATANVVVGTPTAIFDRARDAIRALREKGGSPPD